MSLRPRIAVIVFPGSNDDRDAAWALGALGADAQLVWHAETELPRETGAVVLPGRLLVRRLPALRRDRALRAGDGRGARASQPPAGPVLGICNGFQILCEAGLLPGVLRRNRDLEFVCRDVALRVERDRHALHRAAASRARS